MTNVLGRSLILNIAGRGLTLLLGLAASIALARALGPSARGLLGVMFSLMDVITSFVFFGLPAAVLYFSARKGSSLKPLAGAAVLQAAALAVILIPATAVGSEALADVFGSGHGRNAWALVGLLVPLALIDRAAQGLLLGRLRFGSFNALSVAAKGVYLLGIIALVSEGGFGVTGALVAFGLTSLVMIGGAVGILRREVLPEVPSRLFRRLYGYGMRVQVGLIFQIVFFRLDVLILQFFVPLASVGRYVVATSLAELVVQLGFAFQQSTFPLASHYEDEKQRETTATAVRHYVILSLIATAITAVLGPLLIAFGFGPGFRGAIVPLLILLPGMWLLGTGLVVAGDLRGRGGPGLASLLGGGGTLLVVALDLALIPALGINGAAMASLVAYSLFGVASIVALARVSGIPVRDLVVPRRADLAVYLSAPRTAAGLFRRVDEVPR